MVRKTTGPLPAEQRAAVDEAMAAERERVQRLIDDERAEEKRLADDAAWRRRTGDEPRTRPTREVEARRLARSNAMPANETEDTIGRLWAWGFLDGGELSADLLRDAGRRYAASYWRRYGPVSPKSGHYEEMTGRSSSGPSMVVIPDEDRDRIAEERFQRRDDALRAVKAKQVVDQVCVDGAGDNDPAWLIDTMNGFPAATRQERLAVANAESKLARAVADKAPTEWATRQLSEANRALHRKILQTRIDIVPHGRVALIVLGLNELARIDRSEGLHRPRRGRPPKTEEN